MNAYDSRTAVKAQARVAGRRSVSPDSMDLLVAGFAIVAAVLMSFLR